MSQQINLYNPLFRKKGFSLISAAGMACAFGAASAGALLAAVYAQHELRQVEAQAQAIDQAHKAASANRDKLTAEVGKQKPNARVEAEIAALERQLNDREDIIAALKSGTVGSTDGFSDYMRAFSRQSVSGLWLTGFDIAQAGNALALQGRTLGAEYVASYLKRLNQEKTMQGRQFAAMRISLPPPQPAAANAVTPGEAKGRKPSLPRYLEFTISTLDIADSARPAANSASVAPPLLGPLNAAAGVPPAQTPGPQAGPR